MKNILIVFLIIVLSVSTCYANQKILIFDGDLVVRKLSVGSGIDINERLQQLQADGYDCEIVDSADIPDGDYLKKEGSAIVIDEDATAAAIPYNPDELITWALQQVFVSDLIPHMAAFLDFANKATVVSRDNFLAYATAVSLTETANQIITKARELNAEI